MTSGAFGQDRSRVNVRLARWPSRIQTIRFHLLRQQTGPAAAGNALPTGSQPWGSNWAKPEQPRWSAHRQQDVRSWELPTAAVDRGCVKTRLHTSNAQESSRPQVEMRNESARTAPAGFVSCLLPLRHDVFTQPRPIPAVRAPTAERPALTRSRLTQHGQMIDPCLSGCRTQPQHVVRGHRPSLEVKHLFVRQTLLCYIAMNNAVSRLINRA